MKLQKNNKPVKIKDPKQFNINFNKFIKALVISTTIVISAVGIKIHMLTKDLKPTDKKTTISEKYNEFENFIKIKNNNTYYKAENVEIAINKETLEVDEYIQDVKINDSSEIESYKLYEISTGDLVSIYEPGILIKAKGTGYNMYLHDNFVFYSLKFLQKNTETGEYKEWYTLEEIKEIEEAMVQKVKQNRDYQKIK